MISFSLFLSHSQPLGQFINLYIYVFIYCLGLNPQHMEVPGLGVELGLQPQAYTIATAMLGPSHICTLCQGLCQHQILNPLSQTRDETRIPTDSSASVKPLRHNRNSSLFLILRIFAISAKCIH